MFQFKNYVVVVFALFSLFFGAGNLILPPMLGHQSGMQWGWVGAGFILTAVIIPVLGIWAHANLRGTLFDFGKKVSPTFSLVYCLCIYAISISFPAPRTASVTHELVVQPIVNLPGWVTSMVYFILVYFCAANRVRVLQIIGKWLTPILVLVIGLIVIGNVFNSPIRIPTGTSQLTFAQGLLEGYQTFDAIGSVVVGGVILISLKLNFPELESNSLKKVVLIGGITTGILLAMVYVGLIYSGAIWQNATTTPSRTEVLQGISFNALGSHMTLFFGLLIALACFTTAVGIITGTADFLSEKFSNTQITYKKTVLLASFIGFVMGQLPVNLIISVAMPILLWAYPITIVLILLNILPNGWQSSHLFRWVTATALLFSLPDVFEYFGWLQWNFIPFQKQHFGWVLPSLFTFVIHLAKSRLWSSKMS